MKNPGFWPTFFKLAAFMLIAGIVGPIFIVMYFVIGDVAGAGLSWMLWTGIAVTVLDIALAWLIAAMMTKGRMAAAQLQAEGFPAVADVTSLTETSMQINDRRVIAFDLRIHGPRVPAFEATLRTPVPTIAIGLLSARKLAVIADPATQKFEVDWNLTQLYAGFMPTRITSVEDGRTYDLTGNSDALVEIFDVLSRHGLPVAAEMDLRGNPEARAEVMAIAERYGGAPGSASPGSASPGSVAGESAIRGGVVPGSAGPGSAVSGVAPAANARDGRTLTQRLGELDHLYAGGRINRAEYETLRAKVIADG